MQVEYMGIDAVLPDAARSPPKRDPNQFVRTARGQTRWGQTRGLRRHAVRRKAFRRDNARRHGIRFHGTDFIAFHVMGSEPAESNSIRADPMGHTRWYQTPLGTDAIHKGASAGQIRVQTLGGAAASSLRRHLVQ